MWYGQTKFLWMCNRHVCFRLTSGRRTHAWWRGADGGGAAGQAGSPCAWACRAGSEACTPMLQRGAGAW